MFGNVPKLGVELLPHSQSNDSQINSDILGETRQTNRRTVRSVAVPVGTGILSSVSLLKWFTSPRLYQGFAPTNTSLTQTNYYKH